MQNEFARQGEFLWGEDAKRLLALEDPIGWLLSSDGWKELHKIGTEQANNRVEILLSSQPRPHGPSDDFLKGAIFGIRLLLGTPTTIMQQARELHEQRAKEIN